MNEEQKFSKVKEAYDAWNDVGTYSKEEKAFGEIVGGSGYTFAPAAFYGGYQAGLAANQPAPATEKVWQPVTIQSLEDLNADKYRFKQGDKWREFSYCDTRWYETAAPSTQTAAIATLKTAIGLGAQFEVEVEKPVEVVEYETEVRHYLDSKTAFLSVGDSEYKAALGESFKNRQRVRVRVEAIK